MNSGGDRRPNCFKIFMFYDTTEKAQLNSTKFFFPQITRPFSIA